MRGLVLREPGKYTLLPSTENVAGGLVAKLSSSGQTSGRPGLLNQDLRVSTVPC